MGRGHSQGDDCQGLLKQTRQGDCRQFTLIDASISFRIAGVSEIRGKVRFDMQGRFMPRELDPAMLGVKPTSIQIQVDWVLQSSSHGGHGRK